MRRGDPLPGHRVHEAAGVADEHAPIQRARPRATVRLDDAADGRSSKLEPIVGRPGRAHALEERVEQRRDRDVLATARLGEDADADVDAAAGHREHPAIAGEERAIEPEHRLADVGVHARRVRPASDRDVALVVAEDVGRRGDDRVDAVGTGDERRAVPDRPALRRASTSTPEPSMRTRVPAVSSWTVAPADRGRVEHHGVEVLARDDVAVRRGRGRRGRRTGSGRGSRATPST